MTSTNPQLQDIVKRFGTSDDVAEQAAALSELMKIKQHHQAAKDPLFERGVQTALRVAGTRSDPERRLVAVATLLRIAELVKAWQPRIAKALSSVWTEALPPLQSAVDPDDRYYLAKLWHYEEQPWGASDSTDLQLVDGLHETGNSREARRGDYFASAGAAWNCAADQARQSDHGGDHQHPCDGIGDSSGADENQRLF